MKRILLLAVFIAVASLGLYGCGRTAPTEPATSNTQLATDEYGNHIGHGEHHEGNHVHHDDNGQSAMEKMTADLATLLAEDHASAEKQYFCPVSVELLRTMGSPQKNDLNGQQVWICCDDCEDKLLENPDKYVARLQKSKS